MPRFTNAFSSMFEGLTYNRVENITGHKEILFRKGSDSISIDELSSGEKQVVCCGCFLLKDVNTLNGAFVFIDEPEISLHPSWQKKIMSYYKGIFTDENGVQTSQIFVVTHSPFIIIPNKPRVEIQGKSPIHLGTAMLRIENVNLEGNYYTGRDTRGSIQVSVVKLSNKG